MKDTPETPVETLSLTGIEFADGTHVDQVLSDVADALIGRGLRVAGLIQIRGQSGGDCNCREMHLRDLHTGKLHRISEERGPEARGCHLDWEALMTLAQSVEQNLSDETDVLIINRFGRSESEGRGFRGAIEKALSLGIRVIVAVRGQYGEQWGEFHGGMAHSCPPDKDKVLASL